MISKTRYNSMVCFLVFILSFAAISPSKSCAVPPSDTFSGLNQPCDISGAERYVGNKPEYDFGKPHDMITMSGWKHYQSFCDAKTRGQITLPGAFSRSIEGEGDPFTRTIPEDFQLKRTPGPSLGNADTARRNETSFTASLLWGIETVDTAKRFWDFGPRAIAVDVDDNPHIVYGGDHLYYAYHDSNGWHYETVDWSSRVGTFASLGIDASGKVHISYHDWGNGDLKYATNKSDSWVIEAVDGGGFYTSLAIDSTDKVHISNWSGRYNCDLKYATNQSGSWVTETVDSEGDVGWYTSLAIDSTDKVHISYYKYSTVDLKYATNKSGSWITEMVDSERFVGRFTSLAIDPSDKVHISYHDSSNTDLKYATNKSGSWVTETIDSEGDVGRNTSLAIDSTGNVHISYHRVNGDLKYATNKSGSWVTETIDSEGYVGFYTSLAMDSTDKVHINYYDASYGDLMHATNKSGSWVIETVDSGGSYPSASLAIDSSDRVHIGYHDSSKGDLKYARSPDLPLESVNNLVAFEPIQSTYTITSDTTDCPPGFVGKFSFDAKITYKGSSPSLSNLVVQVKKLTNGNLLHNADGGHGGEGSTLTVLKKDDYSDGILSPGEFVDVHFIICLKEKKSFTFLVDVFGVKEAGETDALQVAEPGVTSTESRRAKFRKGSRVARRGFFGRFHP